MPRTPAPILYAQLLVASLRPADPSPASRAPTREDAIESRDGGVLTSFLGVSLDEMRELADRLPQVHHQYDSKTSIDPKLIEESMGFGDPGNAEGYTYDTLESFETRMAARREGRLAGYTPRIRTPQREYGEELSAEELGLKR